MKPNTVLLQATSMRNVLALNTGSYLQPQQQPSSPINPHFTHKKALKNVISSRFPKTALRLAAYLRTFVLSTPLMSNSSNMKSAANKVFWWEGAPGWQRGERAELSPPEAASFPPVFSAAPGERPPLSSPAIPAQQRPTVSVQEHATQPAEGLGNTFFLRASRSLSAALLLCFFLAWRLYQR